MAWAQLGRKFPLKFWGPMADAGELQIKAEATAQASGLGKLERIERILGGGNNKVARARIAGKDYLYKLYFYSPNDPRDRLGNEYAFIEHAWSTGCHAVPQPYFRDNENRAALYEFISGERVSDRPVTDSDIRAAVDFVTSLNSHKAQAEHSLPVAADGGFTMAMHVENTEKRMARFSTIEVDDDYSRRVQKEIASRILPHWQRAKSAIAAAKTLQRELAWPERIISPSDFGFHNAIQAATSPMRFIDFEFGGWDDPVKLICDFANQPDNILPDRLSAIFRDAMIMSQPESDDIAARIRLLEPVFQLKWVCIILNLFLPVGRDRVKFLGRDDIEGMKKRQIDKMDIMLLRVENSLQHI